MADQLIPVFLSIDVEPDGFQLSRSDPPAWAGFEAMLQFVEELRVDLAAQSGIAPAFGWYFRTDPQIAEVYGRADHALHAYDERIRALAEHGDYFGVHPHALRWSEPHQSWVHDFADPEWLKHSTQFALDAFADWSGTPTQRLRNGAGFLSNEIIDTADHAGVTVDLSLEPVASWGLNASEVPTSIDSSQFLGAFNDCQMAPRRPYHPDPQDFRSAAGANGGRRILMVPWSTARFAPTPGAEPAVQVLFPSIEWPSETYFWDLAARELQSMQRPYLSLAVRTDAADMQLTARVRRIFAALPRHPLSQQLRVVDPLDAAASLVSDSASAVVA